MRWTLPGMGYVHTGLDPEGRFLFFENMGDTHEVLSAHFPHDPERFRLNLLRRLGPIPFGQRYHAHPFLSPDREWMYFTEVVDGFSQVSAVDVSDLVGVLVVEPSGRRVDAGADRVLVQQPAPGRIQAG